MHFCRTCALGLAVLPVLAAAFACSSSTETQTQPLDAPDAATDSAASSGPVTSLWVAPAQLSDLANEHFYDHPWPSALRLDADGSPHWTGFYNPRLTVLLDGYVQATKGLTKGFSPTAFGYMRFSGDVDPKGLPASPQASLDPQASVQILDVDPSSPEHGRRRLAMTYWQQADGVYWLKDTLAVGPAIGYPLRPSTRYAVVVTSKLHAADGSAIVPSEDLQQALGVKPPTPRTQAAHDLFAPAVAEVQAAGIALGDIVQFTSFTTDDPTAQLFAIDDDIHARVPAPTIDPQTWQPMETTADYDVYQAKYGPSPMYQAGTLPFASVTDGGGFVFDASGKPVQQGSYSLRFTLVVPNAQKCPMPASGYPIVLYAHGTGGDYRSIVDEGNSFGQLFAQSCLASMGIDQVFHGQHPGAPPPDDPNLESDEEIRYYNFENPLAGRTNGQQGAIDVIQQGRLFTDTHATVPSSVSRTGSAIAFDASKLMFAGHSQGGQNGSLFLAADAQARGGILSGSGSFIVEALLEKTSPTPSVASLVRTILSLKPDEASELNFFHPALNLAQSIVDAGDPLNYVGFITAHPRPGHAPKSVYQSEGVRADGTGDTFAPPHGIELGAVASGYPRMAPGTHPVAEATFSGLGDVTVPVDGLTGNMAAGQATCILAQFAPPAGHDGHFVLFDVPQAHAQAGAFMKNLAVDPKGLVPPLQ